MVKIFRLIGFLIIASFVTAFIPASAFGSGDIQIAFMADVHFQDIYGSFNDTDYTGVINPGTGKNTIARTMEAQLHSTRLFNENYFAFLAALDDVVKRGVKYVALPGDFSDDGQPINVRGLKLTLDEYSKKHGITFLITTGNHDPVLPFRSDGGKRDFMGEGGRNQIIVSNENLYKRQNEDELQAVVSSDIQNLGYKGIIETLDQYGFFPKKSDLYWESPFSSYCYDKYEYDEAYKQAAYETRMYEIPPSNSRLPDVSYLVEPSKGLWFLAIDANVYRPKAEVLSDPENPASYNHSGIGYNAVLTHKKYLIEWVRKVAAEAEKRGKTLIAFSHYPMVDFSDGAMMNIRNLFGDGKMQIHRIPDENVAQIFADAGIKLHFAGHMHINDTGVRTSAKGNTLVNIQIPSLAAYTPAYKLLTIKNRNLMEIQTIRIDVVPRFRELFPLYEMEYAHLESLHKSKVWNKKILQSVNYKEYCLWHLKELVRLRFLPDEWPLELAEFLVNATGKDLLDHTGFSDINAIGLDITDFENWTGFDLICDLYKLLSADEFALTDIDTKRLMQYQVLTDAWFNMEPTNDLDNQLKALGLIFQKFLNDAPSVHFELNLKNGNIRNLKDIQ